MKLKISKQIDDKNVVVLALKLETFYNSIRLKLYCSTET